VDNTAHGHRKPSALLTVTYITTLGLIYAFT